MTRSRRLLLAFSLATSWAVTAAEDASGSSKFQWKWANNMISTELTQCESYGVNVLSLASNSSSFGTPPYYMIAWKANGVPTVSPIGSDPDSLSWIVNQASGSSLILTVADSLGMSGGEAVSLYNVTDGSNSSCLPPAPTGNFTLVANLSTSDPLETCDPLGLRVYGGQKPYAISIAAVGSSVITNVTMKQDDDVLTWPNLADPGGQLMVSVSDANGTWGTSTGVFNTAGDAVTNNTRCSVVTNSGNSANIDQHPPQPSSSNHTGVIVGVVVAVVVVLFACLAFFLWRRRRQQKAREPEPAFLPDAWTGPSIMETDPSGNATYSPYDAPPSSKMARYRDELSSHSRTSSSQQAISMGLLSAEASNSPQNNGSFSGTPSGSRSNDDSYVGGKGRPRLPPGVSSEWTVEPDIIIQHRDGGAVQEIPPPYPTYSAEDSRSQFSPALASSTMTGLRVGDSSIGELSRPSSSGEPSTSGSIPTISGPTLNKGKTRQTDLLS